MEVCRGSKLQAHIRFADVPVLSAALHLAQAGYATGASDRNWASCEAGVKLPDNAASWHRKLLTDPQTSGGLLIACSPDAAGAVLSVFAQHGFRHAAVIGELREGAPAVRVS
jgi:selenide,water dikinase